MANTGGCCNFSLIGGWKIILLPYEINRIAAVLQRTPSEFVDTSPLIPPQLQTYLSDYEDSIWVRLFLIWHNPTGIKHPCPFLTSKGCSIPYESKPFICQAYPLTFHITAGILCCPNETSCPIGRNQPKIEEVVKHFGDNLQRLNEEFIVFRRELITLLNLLEKSEGQFVHSHRKTDEHIFWTISHTTQE